MKKIKNKFMAGARGGILTSMMLVGAASASAQTVADYASPVQTSRNTSGMHMMHRYNSKTKVSALVRGLGLSKETVRGELATGKTIKQILQEHGITMDQLDSQK